jgi:hypothetical protein
MAMDHMCDSRQMVVLQSRLTVLYRTRPHQSRTQWPLTTPEHLNEHVSVRSSLYHATNQHDSTVTAPGSLTAWPEKAYELRWVGEKKQDASPPAGVQTRCPKSRPHIDQRQGGDTLSGVLHHPTKRAATRDGRASRRRVGRQQQRRRKRCCDG